VLKAWSQAGGTILGGSGSLGGGAEFEKVGHTCMCVCIMPCKDMLYP
jgi:hypothetical protein